MKTTRTLRLAALGAALLVGVGTVAVAQPPAGARQPGAAAERGQRGDRPARGERQARGPRGPRGGADRALMRGITLTDAQRQQVRGIHEKYATERQTLARTVRERAGLANGQRPDSATRARVRSELMTQTRALTERQTAELRNVLTAEQQATFDRNLTEARERFQARAEHARTERGAKGERPRRGPNGRGGAAGQQAPSPRGA